MNELQKNIAADLDSRLQLGRPNFLFAPRIPSAFVRDPDSIMAGVDLTCASPWNAAGSTRGAGTLITRRHVMLADHMWPRPSPLIFVANDNSEEIRKLVWMEKVGGSDLLVGTLDSDLPENYRPAALLPPDWQSKLEGIDGLPAVCLTQNNKATIQNISTYYSDAITSPVFLNPDAIGQVFVKPPTSGPRKAFYDPIVEGDSGQPIFLIINGRPVLLTVFTGPTFGYFTTRYLNEITEIIKRDGAYAIDLIDLSPAKPVRLPVRTAVRVPIR